MNCKPGQRATIVRSCAMHGCISQRLGVPVTVRELLPVTGPASLLMVMTVGPVWHLEEPLSCPKGEPGCALDLVPDYCLKPFDDDSAPTVDDLEDQLKDIQSQIDRHPDNTVRSVDIEPVRHG